MWKTNALRIDSPVEKPGWKPRSLSGYGRAPFPGTPLVVDGEHYEIVLFRWTRGTFPRYFYYLAPWDEQFPIPSPVAYTPESCRAVLEARKALVRSNRSAFAITLLTPLVGLLPADDQRDVQQQQNPADDVHLGTAGRVLVLGSSGLAPFEK